MFSTSIVRAAALALLTGLGVALLAGAASAQTASLASVSNGVASFTFSGVPEGGLSGTIDITVNGVTTSHPFSVQPGGRAQVTLPPGFKDDPDAWWEVFDTGRNSLGEGGLGDV